MNDKAHNHYVEKRSFSEHDLFADQQPLLSHLDIELTERCNNACVHCYINRPEHDQEASSREWSTSQWLDLLSQAADLGALSVRFSGGEPLLRSDFGTVYTHARRLGLKVILFTNARLITNELADLFARIPPLKPIEVSVYGMRPESYDAVAGISGAFVQFRKGVHRLRERAVPFIVKSVLLPDNIQEINAYETWASTLPGAFKKPSYSAVLDLRARRDSPEKNARIKSLRLSPAESLPLLVHDQAAFCQAIASFSRQFMRPQGDHLFQCGAGESVCVDAYGVCQMCMLLRHPDTVYSLETGSLRDALTGFFPGVRDMRAKNPEYLRRCAKCFLKGLCEQCPGKSWSEHGTLDTPVDYLCQMAHAQAIMLGLLSEGERAWQIADWRQRLNELQKQNGFPDPNEGVNGSQHEEQS